METLPSVAEILDDANFDFTSGVKAQLADLSVYTTAQLSWLMVEHFQFSNSNTAFLAQAANVAKAFSGSPIQVELLRNLDEENGHAAMYRSALSKIGVAVENRKEFVPTTCFFDMISDLISDDPSRMLGAMYATETAAIFQHEVFRAISGEVIARGDFGTEGRPLIAFHDMHLGGVEQSHKDELGIFLQKIDTVNKEPSEYGVIPDHALDGGWRAIISMKAWWGQLLKSIMPLNAAA